MSVTVGLFVERVSVSADCRPTLALGFVSAIDGPGDGDAVCVTCPTTYQKWKVDRALVQQFVGDVGRNDRQRAQRHMKSICKPSEDVAVRLVAQCSACDPQVGRTGGRCGHLPKTFPDPNLDDSSAGVWTFFHIF